MISTIKRLVKPVALKLFYTYKKLFFRAPLPPEQITSYTWGKAQYEHPAVIPKLVWLYWHDEHLPEISKLCIKKIEVLNPGYKVHLVTYNTLKTYVPEIIPYESLNKELRIANYSDLVRLSLLEKYGGFYLDASVILNVSLDYFTELATQNHAELILFNLASITEKSQQYPMTENWFLGAVQDSAFIKDWKEEYLKCISSQHPKSYYLDSPNYLNYVQKMPVFFRDYLLAYISSQVVMQNHSGYKLLFLKSEESGYLYIKDFFWKFELVNDVLTKLNQPERLPLLIKLANDGRVLANNSLVQKSYLPSSILGNLAKLNQS